MKPAGTHPEDGVKTAAPRRTAGASADAPPEETGILGIGIDLVDTDRLREVMHRWGPRFAERVFLARERAYCDAQATPWRHYAGRFAVKEAVSKAFGTGIGEHLGWLDIEVEKDAQTGAPWVRLRHRGNALAAARGVYRIWVSLSHSRDQAVAQAVLVGRPRGEKEA